MIGKLLGAASVGGSLVNIGMLNRFLTGIASIVMLAVVCAFMLCSLIAGIFTLAYFGLVHYGLDPFVAAIALSVIGAIIVGGLLYATIHKIRELRNLPFGNMPKHFANLPDVHGIIDAFVGGFMRHKDKSKK